MNSMPITVMDKKIRAVGEMISASSPSSSASAAELALGAHTHTQLANGDIMKQEGCRPGLCGSEAACNPKPDNTYECVCPHDGSPPTPDLKCPNRITVTATPRPIIIFIPPRDANATGGNTTSTQQQAVREERIPMMNGLLIGMLGVALLAVVISVALCLIKRKEMSRCISRNGKNRKSSCSPSPLSLSKGLLVPNRYTPNPQYSACATPDAMLVPLLSRENVHFLQEIGEGCFGKVYKGELQRESEVDIVAVKVLKDTATREAEEDLIREVDIMSAFRHPNILSLVGVVARDSAGNSPWMVFEYMPHGDLAEVLRSNSRPLWKPLSGLAPLTKISLLSVAVQVAAGMEYLAGQRFVHRDLACRNCLVGAGLTVKIADFGMSRDVYTCDYYKIGGSRLLPVRWMSPESVMYGRFTLESDVWSYGVVLWEIYSLGKQPYYGHTNEEVVKLILQGIMLIPPEDCPTVICELMRSCWKTEPRDRIRFTEVYSRLRKAFEDEEASNPSPTPPPLPATPPPPLTEEEHLPRSPGAFSSVCLSESAELLDSENYLLPQVPSPDSRREYLQPLPD